MRRSFGFDVLACPRCGGRLRLVALIEEATVIERILRHLGMPAEVPAARAARAPPLWGEVVPAIEDAALPPDAHSDSGAGSKANGGELLFLALATCYCNDIYREAAKRGMTVTFVEVEVSGEFGGEGEPTREVRYRAKVAAQTSPEEIQDLMLHTDRVAEIQKTLREGARVTLTNLEVEPVTATR